MFIANTVLGYGGGQAAGGRTPWFEWIAKHEEAGTLNGILGELGSTVLSVMKIIGFQIHRLSMTHGLEPILRLSQIEIRASVQSISR